MASGNEQVEKPISELITDNTLKTWYALDNEMFQAHRAGNNDYAESTARILLANADLPLLLRARACMILGCSIQPDFLDMAKEAVRIARMGVEMSNSERHQQLLKNCETVLREAQEAYDNAEEEEEGEEELEEEQAEEISRATGVSAPDEAAVARAEGAAAEKAPQTEGKKSRRLETDPTKTIYTGDEPPRLERSQRQRDVGAPSGRQEDDDVEMSPGSPGSATSRRRSPEKSMGPAEEEQGKDEGDDPDRMEM